MGHTFFQLNMCNRLCSLYSSQSFVPGQMKRSIPSCLTNVTRRQAARRVVGQTLFSAFLHLFCALRIKCIDLFFLVNHNCGSVPLPFPFSASVSLVYKLGKALAPCRVPAILGVLTTGLHLHACLLFLICEYLENMRLIQPQLFIKVSYFPEEVEFATFIKLRQKA